MYHFHMDNFSNRLRSKMKEFGETQESLAEKIDCSHGLIGQYIRATRRPRLGNLEKLARVLNTSPEWLMYGAPSDEISDVTGRYHKCPVLPLLTWAEVYPIIHQERLRTVENMIPIAEQIDQEHCFALPVNGDSMHSIDSAISFPSNGLIIVNKNLAAKHKDFIVCYQQGADEAVFRQYIKEGNAQYLKPLNTQYPIITVTSDISILGVATNFIMTVHQK